MSYALCCVPVAPLRLEPDHRTEMVSQLLFGECCIVTFTQKDGWVKIVQKTDAGTGWCREAHLQEIDETLYYHEDCNLAGDWVNDINYNGHLMKTPFGSSLTGMKNGHVNWRKNTVHFSGTVWEPALAQQDAKSIKQLAFRFLNTAYLWGGRSVFGVDCSGLTQSVYRMLNVHLLRNARDQATQGEPVNFLQEAHCGDLAFFDDGDGQIIHTGLLLNSMEILHADGKVKVDKIDNEGIVDAETGKRSRMLRIIKRFI